MSRFRRQQHDVPGLNLASMPDLIFTVLFFFMIVTHMRDVQPKVQYEVPQGTEVEKSPRQSNVVYIFIGQPLAGNGHAASGETRIQLNDRLVDVGDIEQEIARVRALMSDEDRRHLTVSIRADRETPMGVINDVKQALRRAGALNVNYAASQQTTEKKM